MKNILFLLLCALFSMTSYAYKSCEEEIKSIYVGDNGFLWVSFKTKGLANMPQTDVDFKSTLSVLLAAHMANRKVVMRYTSDSATCSETRSDIRGVTIL